MSDAGYACRMCCVCIHTRARARARICVVCVSVYVCAHVRSICYLREHRFGIGEVQNKNKNINTSRARSRACSLNSEIHSRTRREADLIDK